MPHSFWDYNPPRNHPLAPRLYATADLPCVFTIRASPGAAPFAAPPLASIAIRCLLEQRTKSACQVLVYCLMPDHLHVVVAPVKDGASSLDFVMRYKGWCASKLHLAGWQGPVWQRRSYDRILRHEDHLPSIAAYILANPVRKGLVDTWDQYPYSGIPDPINLDPAS